MRARTSDEICSATLRLEARSPVRRLFFSCRGRAGWHFRLCGLERFNSQRFAHAVRSLCNRSLIQPLTGDHGLRQPRFVSSSVPEIAY